MHLRLSNNFAAINVKKEFDGCVCSTVYYRINLYRCHTQFTAIPAKRFHWNSTASTTTSKLFQNNNNKKPAKINKFLIYEPFMLNNKLIYWLFFLFLCLAPSITWIDEKRHKVELAENRICKSKRMIMINPFVDRATTFIVNWNTLWMGRGGEGKMPGELMHVIAKYKHLQRGRQVWNGC